MDGFTVTKKPSIKHRASRSLSGSYLTSQVRTDTSEAAAHEDYAHERNTCGLGVLSHLKKAFLLAILMLPRILRDDNMDRNIISITNLNL